MGFRRSLVRIQSPRHEPQGAKQQRVATNLAASLFTPPDGGFAAENCSTPPDRDSGRVRRRTFRLTVVLHGVPTGRFACRRNRSSASSTAGGTSSSAKGKNASSRSW